MLEARTHRSRSPLRLVGPVTLATASTLVFLGTAAQPASAQGGGGGRGGPGAAQPEIALVDQFDRDKDGILNAAERAEAKAALPQQGGGGGFGPPPGGPPPGGFGPPPGGGAPVGPPPGGFGPPPGGGRGGGGGGRGGGRGGFAPASAGVKLAAADVRSYPAAIGLYDHSALRTFFLTLDVPEWESEMAAFYNTDVELPATVVVDGKSYSQVGLSFRGQSSFRNVPAGSKRSLKLHFDLVDEDQEIGGYRTLNLLNANGDPTFLRAMLYSEISRRYIPAPKVNLVRVVINGENWGLYASAQQFNKDFLRDYFGGVTDGARWKVPGSPGGRGGLEYLGDDPSAYKRLYEIKTKDDPKVWADFIHLTKVLNETPAAQLEAALAPILDIDGALKFLALDVALINSDGYWTRASDYDIYQDPKGIFHIIPHDMNEGMGAESGPVLDPLTGLNDATKPLRSKLLAVPALRERYMGYVTDIAQNGLDWSKLEPLVNQYVSLIQADVQRDTRKLYTFEQFQAGITELKGWVEQRRASLLGR